MEQIFQRLLDSDLAELPGLTVHATVPVPEALANELLAAALPDNANISDLHTNIHPENRLTVDVKSPRWPWPFHLKLKLFSSIDLMHPPKLRAFLENNQLLGKVGELLGALPPGVTLYQDQLSVDLSAFIPPEQRKFMDLLQTVDVSTEDGRIILDVKIRK